MKKVVFLVSASLLLLVASSMVSAQGWTENFNTLANWTTAQDAGYVAPVLANVPSDTPDHGNSYKVASTTVSRIWRPFNSGASRMVVLNFNIYDDSPTSVGRTFGGFGTVPTTGTIPPTSAGLFRLGKYNAATYQVQYYGSALQTISTPVAVSKGWHAVELKMNMTTKTLYWKIDSASGSVENANLVRPNAVIFGFNYSNSSANTYYDDVTVTPEPSSLLALGTGLMGLVGFARRRRA